MYSYMDKDEQTSYFLEYHTDSLTSVFCATVSQLKQQLVLSKKASYVCNNISHTLPSISVPNHKRLHWLASPVSLCFVLVEAQ